MDTLISCECYQGTCQVSSVFAQLIIAHSSRNWSCVWIISALRGSWAHTHIHSHTGTWGKHSWSAGVAPSCDCKLLLTGLWLRVPWLPIMYYSACIQRPSEELLHELSRSASSLFIITTLSFWVVKYWFCLSLCGSRSHVVTQCLLCRDVCAHFERRWLNFKKGLHPPSPDRIVRAPHSRVSHTTSNEMPCQDTHTHLLFVCTLTLVLFFSNYFLDFVYFG